MSPYLLYAADLVAVALLTFAVYLPRHHRRDLVIAFWGVNIGVLAVSAALATSTVGAGLGLGLFGVLSIIRLRSTELEQQEVAYYFSALALGLLGGLGSTTTGTAMVTVALMALVVLAMYLVGHPRMMGGRRQQLVLLDRAVTQEQTLHRDLEQLLGAQVLQATVQRVDLVNDTTLVDVRYRVPSARPSTLSPPSHEKTAAYRPTQSAVGAVTR